jgi:hypothetical protein
MIIKYSRHAKRRMNLYKIDNSDIEYVIFHGIRENIAENRVSIIHPLRKFKYPIKIVLKELENEMLIITCYPVKRKLGNESIL